MAVEFINNISHAESIFNEYINGDIDGDIINNNNIRTIITTGDINGDIINTENPCSIVVFGDVYGDIHGDNVLVLNDLNNYEQDIENIRTKINDKIKNYK